MRCIPIDRMFLRGMPEMEPEHLANRLVCPVPVAGRTLRSACIERARAVHPSPGLALTGEIATGRDSLLGLVMNVGWFHLADTECARKCAPTSPGLAPNCSQTGEREAGMAGSKTQFSEPHEGVFGAMKVPVDPVVAGSSPVRLA